MVKGRCLFIQRRFLNSEALQERAMVDTPGATERLVIRAKGGDRAALERLVASVQDSVYGLAIRMLYHPADAEDAAQEILIKVVTHLGSLRNPAAFRTWVHRVAANHLLTTRKRRAEKAGITFQLCEAHVGELKPGAPHAEVVHAEQQVLLQEVRIACMQGLLLCLDREHRLAFVLGGVFQVTSREAADILQVTPEAFRQRLSRARGRLHDFMRRYCGLMRTDNPCRCDRYLPLAVRSGMVNPNRILFADHPVRGPATPDGPEPTRSAPEPTSVEELRRLVELYRSHPRYAAPRALFDNLKALLRPEGRNPNHERSQGEH
jgi:RNA polymerase sigma factor (sigma-70 family)